MTNRGPNDRRQKGKPAPSKPAPPAQEKKASFADVAVEDMTPINPIVVNAPIAPPPPIVVGASKK